MMQPPLSRKESQAATRERLLDVATKILFENGYAATSLERIAEAAGFSKGAIYSNFAGKEELVLEVLDRQFLHRLDDLVARIEAAPETADARFEAFIGWWESMLIGEGWGFVVFEFAGATRDNPEIHEQLTSRQQKVIEETARILAVEIDRFGLEPALDAHEIASVLIALGQGLTFSRRLVADVSADLLVKTARAILFGHRSRPLPPRRGESNLDRDDPPEVPGTRPGDLA